MAPLPAALALALVLAAAGCAAAAGDAPPIDDGDENSAPGDRDDDPPRAGGEDDRGPFDPSNAEHYRWRLEVLGYHTLPVVGGSAVVEYRSWPAGATDDQAPRSSGVLERDTTLHEDLSFADLTAGILELRTFRDADALPMTHCSLSVAANAAITSYNVRLDARAPDRLEPTTSNPDDFKLDLLAEPGTFLLVDGDCVEPSPEENPTETRSVLSWLIVTADATPDATLLAPGEDIPDLSGGIDP